MYQIFGELDYYMYRRKCILASHSYLFHLSLFTFALLKLSVVSLVNGNDDASTVSVDSGEWLQKMSGSRITYQIEILLAVFLDNAQKHRTNKAM